jgi:hypothetical protein
MESKERPWAVQDEKISEGVNPGIELVERVSSDSFGQ